MGETLEEIALDDLFPQATNTVAEAAEDFIYRSGKTDYGDELEDIFVSLDEASGSFYRSYIKSKRALNSITHGLPSEETPDRSPESTTEIIDDALQDVEETIQYVQDSMMIFKGLIEEVEDEHQVELNEIRGDLVDAEEDYSEAIQKMGYGLMEMREGQGTQRMGPEYNPVFEQAF